VLLKSISRKSCKKEKEPRDEKIVEWKRKKIDAKSSSCTCLAMSYYQWVPYVPM